MQKINTLAEKYKARSERMMADNKAKQEAREKAVAEFIANNPKPEDSKERCPHGVLMWQYKLVGEYNMAWENVGLACEICASLANNLTKARIPARYVEVPPSDKYLADLEKGGVLFLGGVGSGKTYQLVALLKAYIVKSGNTARFYSFGEIVRQIKDSIAMARYTDVYEEFARCPLLVIDDLGTENSTDFTKEFLYNLINDRYNAMLPILVTTNLTDKELAAAYSLRTVSRLTEMCKVETIKGDDRRKKKVAQ